MSFNVRISAVSFIQLNQVGLEKKFQRTNLKSQKRPSRTMFVYKIQVNPIHTILK